MHNIPPGESPPPPPRTCFGRDELIEKVIGLAENLTPLALVGPGGIGKTSIALTVLHHDRIKQRFGDNRRFIRCDKFPASRAHFLSELSSVIGAGVENPEGLAPLRPFLSSREMILFLDNAESILDPQGTNAQEIYAVVEELSRFKTICLCFSSRISTVPQHCECLTISTLSMESASDVFYAIYNHGGRSDTISNLLRQLDFHPLSTALLAAAASRNMWDYDRLAQEWDTLRVQVLQTSHTESLAATIELSLASPTFREFGPDARDLLGVIAFFPQGINENNIDWLFPTIPRRDIFDKFCVLSLTYRCNGFVTMLAPLRDYLCPKDPASSPLLLTTKERYFGRLSAHVEPGKSGFEGGRWITSEDGNVEHLLDVFTTIDATSLDVWDACVSFMRHLAWHKKRLVTFAPKIEGLPDYHHSKPQCLFELSELFCLAGNRTERKRLLVCALKLWRERVDYLQVARTLDSLSDANRLLKLYKEGTQHANEALDIYERLDDKLGQARTRKRLAWLLYEDGQLDAAEDAASRAINLLPDEGEQRQACTCHHLLGNISSSKGNIEKAIDHFEIALRIASPFDWHDEQFWVYYSLVELLSKQGKFGDAHAQIERAESHAIGDTYLLGRTMWLRSKVRYKECRFREAKSEVLRAVDVFEKLGATRDLQRCRRRLRDIKAKMKKPVTHGKPPETFYLLA